jgi:DNA mismatch repair protein MutS2
MEKLSEAALTNLDWPEILERLASFATSQLAKEQLRKSDALPDPESATESFRRIEEIALVLKSGRRPFMESLDLYSLWHQRLSKGAVLRTLELRDLRHFCLEAIALKEILNEHSTSWLVEIRQGLMEATEPLSAIDQIMSPDGEIRSDASETLYKLFNEKNQLGRQVQSILDRLVKQHEMEPVLQDRYVTNREGRWVLPVKSGKQGQFEGIIHASSATKQTVFMEPKEIIPLNNRLRQVEVDIEEEVERLLTELSEYLETLLHPFDKTKTFMHEADLRLAQAQLATHMSASSCHFSEAEINLKELRHPLLILNNVDVIPNSVHLTAEKRILLLSGPNAGGKTVLLKAVGLAAQMARCGLLISAAEGSKLPFFQHLHVAVGDSQSVDQHLSTFAAHLKILDQATKASGPKYLLLIDEICGSTDPDEGTALARSFIQTYAERGTFGVITSHLGPLKLGWDNTSGVTNGSLEYDNKVGTPTYQFLMGVPGQSLALQTARRVGVDAQVLERAMENLSPNVKQFHLGLQEVDVMKEELRHLRSELQTEMKENRAAKSKYNALIQKFDRDKEKMLEQALRRAEKKVETLIEHSKVDDVFKRFERLEKIKTELPEVIKATPRTMSPVSRIETLEDFNKAYPAGSKVFAPSIGRDGVIQGQPNGKGEIPILSNSMRLMVHWTQLRPPQQASNPTLDVLRRTGESASHLDQDRVVDLRGKNVESAIQQLELQLDTAALHDESRIKIIHGHGSTDALKKGVRSYLSRSHYVKKWKAGTPETGGDGITWAELKE